MASSCSSHRKVVFARSLLCALSLQQLAWAACSRTPWLPSRQLPVQPENSLFYLTPENYSSVAALLATPRKEIILTALSFTHKGQQHVQQQLDFVKNFALHLHRLGLLENTLILSYDNETCRIMQQHAGILCFVDRTAPAPEDLPGQYQSEVPTWFQKYWHAHALNQLNLTVLFMDTDVAVFQDPFLFHDKSYDVEGLSDWNWLEEAPSHQDIAVHGCGVYRMAMDPSVAGGQKLVWEGMADHNAAASHVSPCQSTGVWFSEPTPASLRFLSDFLDFLLNRRLDQWDQAAWNEVIMAHMIGINDQPGLRYRLLPESQFNNMEMYAKRLKAGKPLDEVILHAGGVHGASKQEQMELLNCWRVAEWDIAWGNMHLNQVRHSLLEMPSEMLVGASTVHLDRRLGQVAQQSATSRVSQQGLVAFASLCFMCAGLAAFWKLRSRF